MTRWSLVVRFSRPSERALSRSLLIARRASDTGVVLSPTERRVKPPGVLPVV